MGDIPFNSDLPKIYWKGKNCEIHYGLLLPSQNSLGDTSALAAVIVLYGQTLIQVEQSMPFSHQKR